MIRVRYVRASSSSQSTNDATETVAAIDTVSIESTQTSETPIAEAEYKRGVAWLCPIAVCVFVIIFVVFFCDIVRFIKKRLLLRRN